MHCSHPASSALRRSYAAAPTPTTTAYTAGGKPRATAARAINGDNLFQFFDDDLLCIAAVLLPGTGTAPLREKDQSARAEILPVALRGCEERVVSRQPSCVSCE